jgi:tetratricopeptide (TPR) repeat protein
VGGQLGSRLMRTRKEKPVGALVVCAFVFLLAFIIPIISPLIRTNLASICATKSHANLAWVATWHWDMDGSLTLGLDDRGAGSVACLFQRAIRFQGNDTGLDTIQITNTVLERAAMYDSLANADYRAFERHLAAIAQGNALRSHEALALAKLDEARGDHNQAVAAIRDSRAASDLLYLAGAAFTRGRVEDARRLSSLVIEADPSIPDAYYLLGQINVLYGGTPDAAQAAVDLFSKGVALRPADMMMRAGLAHALVQTRRYEEAREQLRIVLAATPANPTAHLLLGDVYLNESNLDGAISEYEACLELAPGQVWAWYGLGQVYMAQDKKVEAIAAWQRALQINPTFTAAQQALDGASSLQKTGQ